MAWLEYADRIGQISLCSDGPAFLVWSKKNAYDLKSYKRFQREAAWWITRMLRWGGCRDSLVITQQAETCIDGVYCTRVIVNQEPR